MALTVQVFGLSSFNSVTEGLQQIEFNWTDPTGGTNPIDFIEIYRGITLVGTVGAGVQTFTDTGLTPDTLFVYSSIIQDTLGFRSVETLFLPFTTLAQQMTITEYLNGSPDYGDKVVDTLLVIPTPDANTISDFITTAAGRLSLFVSAQDTLDPTVTIVGFPGGDKVVAMTWNGTEYRSGNMAGIRNDLAAELGNTFVLTVVWA